MFNRCLFFMQFFGFLAASPLCGVTWLGTASSDLAPLAVEHVDVIECMPRNCSIATICDYLGVSHFKLQHASHSDALSFDQPIIDNSRSVTSAADGINVQRVDRLFSGLGCSGTGTMFNRCLFFMQFFGFLAVPALCGVTWLGTASSDLALLAVEHVDVIECLPRYCYIATTCDYPGVSHFKLQHASHSDALSFDQPIIHNSRSVTSAADGINVQRVDGLFSGLGCSGTGTMFNRCLFFMQVHFEEDQYEPRRTDRKLKPFAVPTLFSHRKVPKRRRRLVRGGSTNSSTSATTAATVPTTPVVSSSMAKSQPAHLQSATNLAFWAEQAQRMQVTPSAMTRLLTSPVNNGSAFTVATSGGSFILVPATTQVLPSVSCLPNTGPIILVPASEPNMVPVPSLTSSLSTQMPVIMSVKSLAPNTPPSVTKASGTTPILPRPTSYEKLQEEATALRQQTHELWCEVAELSRQLVRVKASLARQTERLSRFLRLDQIECLQKLADEKPTRWTEPTLRLALDIYCCSPEAYRKLLVAHYPFPVETALRTFCIENGVRKGVPTELLQMDTGPEVDGEEENGNINIVWL
ncbi:uncharacterized protein [Dermacentor albipictus]|uniref:uncharacterized protein n=1 Tax=Dermacentor albipictus TaxID=60249 RepID=UPI0038FBF9E2